MTTSTANTRTYWDVYKELSKMADAADQAMKDHEVGSNEWFKAWGYAEAMRQACIESLERHD